MSGQVAIALTSRHSLASLKVATAYRHVSALYGVLREAWRFGYMTAEALQLAVDIKPIKDQKAAQSEKERDNNEGKFAALLDACLDDTCAGAREAAIVALAYACGPRRAELAALQMDDNVAEPQTWVIQRGKGNKGRVLTDCQWQRVQLMHWPTSYSCAD